MKERNFQTISHYQKEAEADLVAQKVKKLSPHFSLNPLNQASIQEKMRILKDQKKIKFSEALKISQATHLRR